MSTVASNMDENCEILCNYCAKKVTEYVKCIKCDELFHPSCLNKADSKKNTQCQHESLDKSSRLKKIQLKLKTRF